IGIANRLGVAIGDFCSCGSVVLIGEMGAVACARAYRDLAAGLDELRDRLRREPDARFVCSLGGHANRNHRCSVASGCGQTQGERSCRLRLKLTEGRMTRDQTTKMARHAMSMTTPAIR